jgi:hypothetical protein
VRGRARFPIWNTARTVWSRTRSFAVPCQTRAVTDGAEPYRLDDRAEKIERGDGVIEATHEYDNGVMFSQCFRRD